MSIMRDSKIDLLTILLDNVRMKKETAISLFGSGAAMGRALGVTRQAIDLWPKELVLWQVDRVIGAAIRLRKITPEQAKELVSNERQRHERSQGIAHGRDDLGDSAGDCR